MAKQEQNKAFSDLMLLFADLYKFPDKNLYEEVKSGEFDKQIEDLSLQSGLRITAHFQDQVENYDMLVQLYNNCLLGVNKPFAPPIESIYKVWTVDNSYQMPHKNLKGSLMGDSALHIKHILKALNMEIPKEYEMMPDHLTIILELLAYLHEQNMLAEAKQFKSDHLDWLLDYHEALIKLKGENLYSYSITILDKALSQIQNDIN